MEIKNNLPILYSFRRCPYAMRARLALHYSGVKVEHREVLLADKPQVLLDISLKATVPVLQLSANEIIDESLDIVYWALKKHDPKHYLLNAKKEQITQLIIENDGSFKTALDLYKYADRYPEYSQEYYREQGEVFLSCLESLLLKNQFLLADKICMADICIFPFIRQFASVDKKWFKEPLIKYHKFWQRQKVKNKALL